VAILGASEFPHSPDLPPSEAFKKSAEDLEAYFKGYPVKLPPENLCKLFDHTGTPVEINRVLSEFLSKAQERATQGGAPIRDLILFYVGHGGFTKGGEQAYFLALRSTEAENEGISSLRMVDLASTIKKRAKDLRRYLILDCCFAEQAYQYYQSSGGGDPANVAHAKALLEFPERGTAMLCSSSKRDFSIAPIGETHTMFSGALLDVLQTGDVSLDTALSLENLGHRVTRLISTKYPDIAVRPKVSSPDQREGNVADIPLFPNAARLARSVEERVANSERKLELILEKLHILDDLSTRLPDLQEKVTLLEQRRDVASNSDTESSLALDSLENRARLLSKAPPLVQVEVRSFRQAIQNGQLWVALSVLLSAPGAFRLITDYTPLSKVIGGSPLRFWLMEIRDPFGWLVIFLATFSLRILLREDREKKDTAETKSFAETGKQSGPEAWETLSIILSMRSSKLVRIFGNLLIASPWFEIGAVVYLLTAALLIFASVTSMLPGLGY
jgi:hypothetical protein